MAERPHYRYRVVSSNGAVAYGHLHALLAKAKTAARAFARAEQDRRTKLGPYEIERVRELDGGGRRYWMRQGKRWVLWNASKDASVRKPDFIVGEDPSGD